MRPTLGTRGVVLSDDDAPGQAPVRLLGIRYERNPFTVKIKKTVAISAALGVALAGLAIAPSVYADPVSNSYVLVGSDTLDASANALANGTSASGASVRITAGGNAVGSFDAFGSTTIQTKPAGPYWARPAGSGEGLKALSRSIGVTTATPTNTTTYSFKPVGAAAAISRDIAGQVDIARSSGTPTENTSGPLLWVPYGRDAVSYAYKAGEGATVPANIGSLTKAELTAIYNNTYTQPTGATIRAKLPQTGSGTRNFWVAQLGIGQTPAGVPDASTTTLQENNAAAISTVPAGEIWIIPFSAANWIAQSNNVAPNTIPGTSVQLGAIGGTAAYTTDGTTLSANPAFYGTAFGRETYVIVEFARVDSSNASYDPALASLVNPSNAKSFANFGSSPASAGAVKSLYGFLAPIDTKRYRTLLG